MEGSTEQAEIKALRARIEQLEREHTELAARANSVVAAAQDQAYWLDRWGLDLNGLMRRRGAVELRAAVRVARAIFRRARRIKRRLVR